MLRVMIVDDNETVRRALRSCLLNRGRWVVCGEAANGLQAVQIVCKLNPDVVLLDFQMPLLDGLSSAREIRKLKPALPIAMYTLHHNPDLERRAKAAGVQKVIPKGDIFSALTENLEELCSSYELELALQTLRDAGHDVGATGLKAAGLFVTIDGVPRTATEVIEMANQRPKQKPANAEVADRSPVRIYDIFTGTIDKAPAWVYAIGGLAQAVAAMNQLAAERPGPYFVYDSSALCVVASSDTQSKKMSAEP